MNNVSGWNVDEEYEEFATGSTTQEEETPYPTPDIEKADNNHYPMSPPFVSVDKAKPVLHLAMEFLVELDCHSL